MHKIVLTSALALLGLGLTAANAFESGYNAADDFGVSEQSDLPASLAKSQAVGSETGLAASSTRATVGYPTRQFGGANRVYNGYNAADDFGPSDQDDLPASISRGRFDGSSVGSITSTTGAERRISGYPRQVQFGGTNRLYRGHNASDDFAVSDD